MHVYIKGVATRRDANLERTPKRITQSASHWAVWHNAISNNIIFTTALPSFATSRYFVTPDNALISPRNKVILITRFTVEQSSVRHSLGLIRSPGIYRECRARTKKTIERGTWAISRSHESSVGEQVLVLTKERTHQEAAIYARNIAMAKRKCAGI